MSLKQFITEGKLDARGYEKLFQDAKDKLVNWGLNTLANTNSKEHKKEFDDLKKRFTQMENDMFDLFDDAKKVYGGK